MMKGKWILVACVFVFTCLVAYRAVEIPVTHDEASTWLNYRYYNLWSCLSDYWCWHTANNHWLNTLLMQWSGNALGESAWALRLPNILAGGFYFVAAALISFRYIRTDALQVSGFLLLSAHLYLLDFFSLFRGYGLMASFILWGIWFLLRYSEHYTLRWLLLAVLSMIMAVLSNFTALLPVISMGVAWFFWLLVNRRFSLILKHGTLWLMAAALFGWLLAYPIRMLNGSGEFEWGSDGLLAMTKDLMNNLLYGFQYFGVQSSLILIGVFLLLLACLSGCALWGNAPTSKKQLLLSVSFLVINLALVVVHQVITGSQAPVGRKSIYLIPVLFTPVVLGLSLISRKTISLVSGIMISVLLLLHTFRPHLWSSCREWYYDAYYPVVLHSIVPAENQSDSIRIGSSWIFNPSLTFYQKTLSLPLSGLVYQKPLVIDSSMQYYYVEQPDTIGMYLHGFLLDNNIGPFFLFKKISDP